MSVLDRAKQCTGYPIFLLRLCRAACRLSSDSVAKPSFQPNLEAEMGGLEPDPLVEPVGIDTLLVRA